MTIPTNTSVTYNDKDISIREDLDDMLYKISPTETPFIQMAGRGKAENTLHEWLVVELTAASDTNAVVEGDDVDADAANNGVRYSNYCQLSDKVAQISSTNEAVNSAGSLTKMAKQIALKVAELKRDMEKQMLSNKAASAGGASTARRSASFISFIRTNASRGAGGAAAVTGTCSVSVSSTVSSTTSSAVSASAVTSTVSSASASDSSPESPSSPSSSAASSALSRSFSAC